MEVLDPQPTLIKTHAKSFHWAALLFPKGVYSRVTELYDFCRRVDDIADELPPEVARPELAAILEDLAQGRSEKVWLSQFIELAKKAGVPEGAARELVIGAQSDLDDEIIADWADFDLYCYRVAGVVGLMMCPLIGVSDPKAYPFAVDLGLAMQMSNICRDVGEDARIGRCYLPQNLLDEYGVSRERLLSQQVSQQELKPMLDVLMERAEAFYESAESGLVYIPARTRLSIQVAQWLYRGIGRKAQRLQYPVLHQRVYLGFAEKLAMTARAFVGFFKGLIFGRKGLHQLSLHQYLVGRPGISQAKSKAHSPTPESWAINKGI